MIIIRLIFGMDTLMDDNQVESKMEIYKALEKSPKVLFQMPIGARSTSVFVPDID